MENKPIARVEKRGFWINIYSNGKLSLVQNNSKKMVAVMVSNKDIPKLRRYHWRPVWDSHSGQYYIVTHGVNGKHLGLHRVVTNAGDSGVVDHINRNTLDNRKRNLRICDVRRNSLNRKDSAKSGYPCVYYSKHDKKWHFQVNINGKRITDGYSRTARECAHKLYIFGKKHFGSNSPYALKEKYR